MENVLHCLKKGSTNKQLIFFPYLGGFANSYIKLANAFNNHDIDILGITLPGHGGSKKEAATSITTVINCCLPYLLNQIKPNCIFFGHSMGGIVAYFILQRILSDCNYPIKPKALVLSACSTPADFLIKHYSKLSDEQLLTQIISYDGIPEEIIHEKRFLEYLLPIFRADFEVLESTANIEVIPLDTPVYYFLGENDKIATIENVFKWAQYFSRDIKLITVPEGSHFFVHKQVEYVADSLLRILS